MAIITAGKTAFSLMRELRIERFPLKPEFYDFSSMPSFRKRDTLDLDVLLIKYDILHGDLIEIAVPKRQDHTHLEGISLRQFGKSMLKGYFFEIIPSVYLPCPEMIFLQLAKHCNKESLFLAGMEMCGTYALSVNNNQIFSGLPAVTSKESILMRLDSYVGKSGLRKAKKVAHYLKDASASPQESRFAGSLCFNLSDGGIGLNNFVMNYEVALSEEAQTICHKRSCRIDICFPQYMLALEYQSAQFHTNENRNEDDLRRIALEKDGFVVISVPNGVLDNPLKFRLLVREIAKKIHRNACSKLKDFDLRQAEHMMNLQFNNTGWQEEYERLQIIIINDGV